MILVVVVGQVQHNRTRLKDTHVTVLQGWDTAIGVDVEEPLLLLGVFGDVNPLRLVLKAELMQRDCWLETIGRAEGVVGEVVEWGAAGRHG